MTKAKALILAACILPVAACAEFKDGNRLLSQINTATGLQYMHALGYVMGVADAFYGVTYCPPGNVTAGQITDMVRNFLENNPAIRHQSADRHVHHVIQSAWPCEQRKRRGTEL
jgi:hypothetical protein